MKLQLEDLYFLKVKTAEAVLQETEKVKCNWEIKIEREREVHTISDGQLHQQDFLLLIECRTPFSRDLPRLLIQNRECFSFDTAFLRAS